MRGYVNNANLPQPPAQGNANVPAPAVAPQPLPGHLDPQLYADYVGLCLFRLVRAGFVPLLVLDGFRNFKESANNAGNVPLTIDANMAGPVYGCCMIRRDALRAMHVYAQIANPTAAQTAEYHVACETASRTVTRETELVCFSINDSK